MAVHSAGGHIYLIGPMGTGKSTVARLLAQRLGRRAVDTDREVEAAAGRSIPEIFAESGEAAFRELESQVLAGVAAAPPAVVGCGGGVVLSPANREVLRATGQVIYLVTPVAELVRRLTRGRGVEDRPLLDGGDPGDRLRAILADRAELYRQTAHRTVATAGLTATDVAQRIEAAIRGESGMATNVRVDLGPRSYSIHIGTGILSEVGTVLKAAVPGLNRALVIADQAVAAHWLPPVQAALQSSGLAAATVTVPAGEAAKNLQHTAGLYAACLDARLERGDAIVTLGGGAVSDLGGFVAATYLRGIAFLPLPTTLLAQVDASVGGKVGVNLPRGKNLVGAFHQPRAVLADVATLATLPEREYRSGLAEVVKHAIIRDRALFRWLEENVEPVLGQDSAALEHLVERNCRIKAGVVAADEREGGLRAILNLGHTVGHAVEAVAGRMFGSDGLLHGEAVSIGLMAALCLSRCEGVLAQADLPERTERLLQAFGLPVRLPAGIDLTAVVETMAFDKKASGGQLRWVLPVRAGQTQVTTHVQPDSIQGVLAGLGDQP